MILSLLECWLPVKYLMHFPRNSNLIGTANELVCVDCREAPMLACEHGEWVRLSTLALQAEPSRCSLCSVHPHHVTPKIDVATGGPHRSCHTAPVSKVVSGISDDPVVH